MKTGRGDDFLVLFVSVLSLYRGIIAVRLYQLHIVTWPEPWDSVKLQSRSPGLAIGM